MIFRRTVALLATIASLMAHCTLAFATFPGKNGRIAFGRFDPQIGWFRLYTALGDGSDARPLTHVPSSFSDWCPDGKRIAFDFFDVNGNEQIATINPDGSELKQITFGSGIHEVPSWSPDGSEIAFDYSPLSPDDPNFFTSIYVMGADGSSPHQITEESGTFDVEPKFSPDGTQIAFVRIKLNQLANDFQPQAVFVVNSDGTKVRQLTPWGSASILRGRPTGGGLRLISMSFRQARISHL
jgi:Tol biopolymer transport system component